MASHLADDPRIRRCVWLARWLDQRFRIPGTRIRFGIDPLLGLFPGVGDAVAAVLGGYLVWTALRVGAPRLMLLRMLANIGIDALVGAIPVAGTVFDVAFKAHHRNAQLLMAWAGSPAAVEAHQRRQLLSLLVLIVSLWLIVVLTLGFGIWALLQLWGFVVGGV